MEKKETLETMMPDAITDGTDVGTLPDEDPNAWNPPAQEGLAGPNEDLGLQAESLKKEFDAAGQEVLDAAKEGGPVIAEGEAGKAEEGKAEGEAGKAAEGKAEGEAGKAEEHVLNDETMIQAGVDADGKAVEVRMGDLIASHKASQEGVAAQGIAGLSPTQITEKMRGYTEQNIDGLSQYKAQIDQVAATKSQINAEYNTLQAQRVAMQRDTDPRLDPSGEGFDGEHYQRTEAQIKRLEAKMTPLYNRWTDLSNQEKAIVEQATSTVTNVVEQINSEVWSEYANPATRAVAIEKLGADIHANYGIDAQEVTNMVRSDPRGTAILRDAVAYRKMATGVSGSEAVKAAINKATGKPAFVYKGVSKIVSKSTGATTQGGAQQGVDEREILSKVNDEKFTELLQKGDLEAASEYLQ